MFDVKLIEAIAYALSRDVVIGDEYYHEMTSIQRKRSVSIAGLAQIEQVKHIINEVNKTLDDGGTFRDFQSAVKNGDININLSKHRLDNIFRTNIQSAYAYGKWVKQQENKVERPYLMYDAVNDSRARDAHLQLDGIVRHIDDPFWDNHTPLLGYRCRCSTRSLTVKQAEKYGITPSEQLPRVSYSDSVDWGMQPKDYGENLTSVVNARISELMLEYSGSSDKIATIITRLSDSVGLVTNKPVTDLSLLIAEAQKLIDGSE